MVQAAAAHARKLLREDVPVILAGDYNVAPTDIDIYPTTSWDDDALVQPESRAAYARLVKQGWTDAIRELHRDERVYTFWHYMRNRWQRDAGLRLDHLLLSPSLAPAFEKLGGRSNSAGQGKCERPRARLDCHRLMSSLPCWRMSRFVCSRSDKTDEARRGDLIEPCIACAPVELAPHQSPPPGDKTRVLVHRWCRPGRPSKRRTLDMLTDA